MRTWIRNVIMGGSFAHDAQDRVYSPGNVDNETPTPFMVVTMGSEIPVLGMPQTDKEVIEIPFDVLVYDAVGSLLDIDDFLRTLKSRLVGAAPTVVGNMSVMRVAFEEFGPDSKDDEVGLPYRRASFRMTTSR